MRLIIRCFIEGVKEVEEKGRLNEPERDIETGVAFLEVEEETEVEAIDDELI